MPDKLRALSRCDTPGHPRFQLPGRRYELEIIGDRDGIFTPSVYDLADGTRLLSYRLGRAAYLQAGDRITARQIPLYGLCGTTCRVIFGYEDLKRDKGL